MPEGNAAEILRKTNEMLELARQGLNDLLSDDPTRRRSGMSNLVVFGRSVTLVLQTLRSVDATAFDRWYKPRSEAMRTDPLLAYFKDLRNEILKEGAPTLGTEVYIEELDIAELKPVMANPPPGAKSFFIGDTLGGSGWEIELPDGSTEKYYVRLPSHLKIQTTLHFPNPPAEHQGEPLMDTSVQNLGKQYIGYLSSLVAEAEDEFGGCST